MRLFKLYKNIYVKKLRSKKINLELSEELKGNLKEMSPTSLSQLAENEDFYGQNMCFLIIDDYASFRNILKTFLEQKGAMVECADNGKLGLEKYLNSPEKYSAILMDIHMPILDGYQVAKQIRESNYKSISNIPIIGISGEAQLEDKYEKYFNHCFQKPFDLDQFIVIIKKMVKKS